MRLRVPTCVCAYLHDLVRACTLPLDLIPHACRRSNAKTKHLLPNGFLKFNVANINEMNLLLMHNRKYCAEINHNVSVQVLAAATTHY
jgi:ribosomal protein L32E